MYSREPIPSIRQGQHKADVNMTTHKTLRRHCKGSKAFLQVCKPLSHLNDTVQVKGKNPIVLMKS